MDNFFYPFFNRTFAIILIIMYAFFFNFSTALSFLESTHKQKFCLNVYWEQLDLVLKDSINISDFCCSL